MHSDSSKLMTREVVQLVTSGTLIEPLSKHANYLMSVTMGTKDTIGLAWIDLSTSQFTVGEMRAPMLQRCSPISLHTLSSSVGQYIQFEHAG